MDFFIYFTIFFFIEMKVLYVKVTAVAVLWMWSK